MSVEAGKPWSYGGLDFHGLSLSGIRTAMSLPQHSLCFDVAQGFPFLLHLKKFLSHMGILIMRRAFRISFHKK